jgi:rRNA maturation protein Nop10
VSREFGQPMQTRTYTVDVSGETRDGTPVSMPSPRTFSFDAQFGRERLDENARLIASDVTDKVRAFWNK